MIIFFLSCSSFNPDHPDSDNYDILIQTITKYLFFMKNGWEIKKLGEVCVLKPQKQEVKAKLKDEDLVSFLPMEDLGIEVKEVIAMRMKQLKEVVGNYTYFADNDILLAKITPCFENGKIGIAKKLKNGIGFGSSEFMVFRNAGYTLPEYIFYFLSRKSFILEGKAFMTGAVGHKRVSKDWIENYPISFPKSLPEQQRIVSILDEAFAAIAEAKKNLERNLQNTKDLFQSELNTVFSKKGEGWVEKKFYEVCQMKPSKQEAKNQLSDEDLVSFLPMEDLGIEKKDVEPVNERKLKEVVGSYTYFAESDVLLAKITPCFENGKIGIAKNLKNGIGFGSSEYIVLRTKGEVLQEIIFYFLSRKSFREEGKSLMTGAVGHKRVSKDWIESYLLQFPKSKDEQQSVVKKLDALSIETKNLEKVYLQKLAALEQLRQSVLEKAFSGGL